MTGPEMAIGLLALVFVFAVMAVRSFPPPVAGAKASITATVLAVVGGVAVVVAAGSTWWSYRVGEDRLGPRQFVDLDSPVVLLAVVVSFLTGVLLVVAAQQRPTRGLVVAVIVSWLTTGIAWLAYLIENGSTRSIADQGAGLTWITRAQLLFTVALVVIGVGRVVGRRRQRVESPPSTAST